MAVAPYRWVLVGRWGLAWPGIAALDAGVPLRDVPQAASHADPRTTMRYDRARASLDRHATYIVAAYVAGAAR
jgi:integrase/recombinase XerD